MLPPLYDIPQRNGDNVKSGMKNERCDRRWRLAIPRLIFLMATSCGRPTAPQVEPIHVVTPVYIVADIVKQIGGDRVDAQWWIEAGQSLDALEPTPERRSQLRNADIVITRGEMDHWTLENQNNEYDARRLIRLDRFLSSRDEDPRVPRYMWLNPAVVLELTDDLTERLCTLDPKNEHKFRANASTFRKKVLALCDNVRPTMDAARGEFLSLDPGFTPLPRYFSLIVANLEPIDVSDVSVYGVKTIKAAAKAAGARAVFVNNAMPGPLLREWENRLDLTVLPLDATGSSAPGSGRSTYLQVLEYDLGQLAAGMKASTTVPSTDAPATTPATTP